MGLFHAGNETGFAALNGNLLLNQIKFFGITFALYSGSLPKVVLFPALGGVGGGQK